MPVPIIAAGAAAVAARLAVKKVAQEVAKKAAKATAAKTAQIAKNSVKVKPAKKTVGNPPNNTKAWESVLSSASRGGVGRTMGKVKDARVAKSTKPTADTAKAANSNRPKVNSSNSVKVLPRKTAPKTDLSNRGTKPTRVERSERAAELSFKKAEGRYEGEYLTRMTGLRGPRGVTSQSTRGQGTRSLRKEAAINKEAKAKIVKINSQRNLKAK